MSQLDSPANRDAIRRNLLRWYPNHRRALPWRENVTPYRVWLSEIMLQQTRVEAALPYYERFLTAFPDVQSLAAAPLESVLKLWERLGYYSRARNLHKAAKIIVKNHNAEFPATAQEWLALPGIGRYTAGAIASVCYGERVPIVDGNVKRVLARIFAIADTVDSPSAMKRFWQIAEELVPPRQSGDFNQAIMELGATICLPRRPACDRCPVSQQCLAFQQNRQDEFPVRRIKKSVPHRHVVAAVIERNGKCLLGQRPESGMLGGLWEFPGGKIESGETPDQALQRELMEECGIEVEVGDLVAMVDHAYSHFSITLHVYRCQILKGRLKARHHTELKWVRKVEIAKYPLPAANLKFLHLI